MATTQKRWVSDTKTAVTHQRFGCNKEEHGLNSTNTRYHAVVHIRLRSAEPIASVTGRGLTRAGARAGGVDASVVQWQRCRELICNR